MHSRPWFFISTHSPPPVNRVWALHSFLLLLNALIPSGPFPPAIFLFLFFSPPILPSLTHSISFIQGGWRQPLSPRPVQLSPLRSFHSCSHSAHISHPWRDAAHFTHSARPIIHQTKTVRTLWSWRSASRCSCDSNPWESVGINP